MDRSRTVFYIVVVASLIALFGVFLYKASQIPPITTAQRAEWVRQEKSQQQAVKQAAADEDWHKFTHEVADSMGYMQKDGICYSVVLFSTSVYANNVLVANLVPVTCTPEIVEKSKHGKVKGD